MILATITGANLFTEPYLLTDRWRAQRRLGVTGARDVPAGIEQGNPDVAAAIGVLLVIGVLADLPGQPTSSGKGLT